MSTAGPPEEHGMPGVGSVSVPEEGAARPQPVLRRVIVGCVKIAITGAVLAYILWKFGWQSILETIVAANPWWVAGAVGVFFVSATLGALQWQVLLRNRGIVLPFGRTFQLYFMGMFFNNFIFGMVAGDAVRVTYLRLGKQSARAGFAATFLDRFAGFWAMSGFAVIATLALIGRRGIQSEVWSVVAVLAVMFMMFVGILVLLMSKRMQALVHAMLERLPLRSKTRLRALLDEMLIEAHDKHILGSVAVLATVVQFLRVAVHVLCAAALGLATLGTLHYFFIFVPILAVTMIAPLPFGVREGLEGSLFALAGFRPDAAVVMGFLASVVGITVSLLGAVFFLIGRRYVRRESL